MAFATVPYWPWFTFTGREVSESIKFWTWSRTGRCHSDRGPRDLRGYMCPVCAWTADVSITSITRHRIRMLSRWLVIVLPFWVSWSAAEGLDASASPGSARCFTGSTTVGTILPACSSLQTSYALCSKLYVGKASSKSALNACVCQQAVFNNIYEYVVIPLCIFA